jgi:hypothetical protein
VPEPETSATGFDAEVGFGGDVGVRPIPWWALIGLAVAVLVGAVARFSTTSPLWLDEALSVNIASLPLGDIGAALRHDGHPPLYYWLLHGWMELFGTGDVAVRSLSGVFSLATLPLAWLAGRRLAGRRGAAWAVVVLALSPYAVRYATEARMYSLVMFLVLAGYVLVTSTLGHERWWKLVLLAGTVGALLWTHYWSMYLLLVTGCLLLWRWWRHPEHRHGTSRVIGAFVVGGLSFVPWVPSFLVQVAHTGTPWAVPSRPAQVLDVTLADLGGGGFSEARGYGAVIVILVFLAAFSRRNAAGQVEVQSGLVSATRAETLVAVGTLLVGMMIGWVTQGAYASRYASVVVPLVLVMAGAALALLRRGWAPGVLAAALMAFGLVGMLDNARSSRTQADDLASSIVAEASATDVVVVCPDQLGPSLTRALDQHDAGLDVIPYPRAGNPRIVDWTDYSERNADADPRDFADQVLARAGQGAIWLVWNGSYRTFEGQCQKVIDRFGAVRQGEIVAGSADTFESAHLYRFGMAPIPASARDA